MSMLLKPFIKIFMLFVAFSIAANAFGGLVQFILPFGLLIVAAALLMGAAGAVKEAAGKGPLHGFLEGVLTIPKLILSVIMAIVKFVFGFVSKLG